MMNSCRKIKGVHLKNTHISVVKCPAKPDFKLMLRHSMFTKMIQFIADQMQTLMNIDENVRN